MKNLYLVLTIVLIVSAFSCADRFSAGYVLELPDVPEPWVTLLGEPDWRIEWLNAEGQKMLMDIPAGNIADNAHQKQRAPEIEIPSTWVNPVTAWPYWENFKISPGIFKPAGAIFPFDVSGNLLRLSWEAGADSVYYWEMLLADREDNSRLPAYFDWVRFRQLFKDGTLSDDVSADPWLINWRTVAEKTVSSGFDRRRLVPEAAAEKALPVPSAEWYGTSPFSKPLSFKEGKSSIFPVRPGVNVWISKEGILRVNGNIWVLNELNTKE